jgi:uncharacterized membrane protein SpoIIM required for sporulation
MDSPFYQFEDAWAELRKLVGRAEARGLKSLADRELRRFCLLYRAATTQLARLRTFSGSERAREHLNSLAARAHALLYAPKGTGAAWRTVLLAPVIIPGVVRRTLPYHLAACALFLAGGLYGFLGAREDPDWALRFVPPGETRTPFAERDELYKTLRQGRDEDLAVSDQYKTAFTAFLWRHNTSVGLKAFFGGVLAAVPTALLLLFNGAFLGVYSAAFHRHGLAYEWWAWILPHGVTEIMAVLLLGGGGLLVGKTILVGERGAGRREAFRRIRGTLMYLVLLAFPLFLIAAIIEGFVRQSELSDSGRYVFAAVSAAVWLAYFTLVGVSRTQAAGVTARTEAEAFVALPGDEELLETLGFYSRVRAERSFTAGPADPAVRRRDRR